MRNQILCRIILLILLSTPLTDAALDRAASLRQFFQSRQARSVDGHAKPDPWGDLEGSFGHLPTKCEKPSGSKAADRIKALPGQPPRVNFRQYAGYVKVDEEHGRELFYYFVESPSDAASKPLVLWINRRSFCSSMGDGAMAEVGPFRVNPDGKTLSRNKHAWNNVANVIFLELPAGVGFSYLKNMSNYESNDSMTTMDAYVFMLHWLERFPEYKGRDFYIAGEQYAGYLVPRLATILVAVRELSGKNPTNLKGIIVGNPNLEWSSKGFLEFMWNHGMMSDEVWTNITHHCSFNSFDGAGCLEAQLSFNDDNIDWSNIYAPTCIQLPNGMSYSSSHCLMEFPGYDPCIDSYIKVYFNNHEVKKAIHARANTHWSTCIDSMSFNMGEAPMTMVPTLSWLLDTGLRVWVYSGDMNAMDSLTETRYAVKNLKLAITKSWRPWYTPANEVGGYIQQYERGFTFASVRGAGLSVPSFQPERALVLFYSFLKGVIPPTVFSGRP
ncbi:hypothetical protein ACP70R_006252 [Stipagrostis hirtigluma subsp. patula]